MTYNGFAYLYDQLMQEAPYDKWFCFFENTVKRYQPESKTVLDVGCGTGSILLKLAKSGYQPTGVDLSADMLTVANEKLLKENYAVPLYEQNMTSLPNIGLFDVIIVFCDSLNYLSTEEEILSAFKSFYNQLNREGLLLFDVHSLYKINKVFVDATFALEDDEISYIWRSFIGEYENSVEHELTFFVKKDSGLYERIDELHKQRTFPVNTYQKLLEEAGFHLLETVADFEIGNPISDTSERIFFIAKKKGKTLNDGE